MPSAVPLTVRILARRDRRGFYVAIVRRDGSKQGSIGAGPGDNPIRNNPDASARYEADAELWKGFCWPAARGIASRFRRHHRRGMRARARLRRRR